MDQPSQHTHNLTATKGGYEAPISNVATSASDKVVPRVSTPIPASLNSIKPLSLSTTPNRGGHYFTTTTSTPPRNGLSLDNSPNINLGRTSVQFKETAAVDKILFEQQTTTPTTPQLRPHQVDDVEDLDIDDDDDNDDDSDDGGEFSDFSLDEGDQEDAFDAAWDDSYYDEERNANDNANIHSSTTRLGLGVTHNDELTAAIRSFTIAEQEKYKPLHQKSGNRLRKPSNSSSQKPIPVEIFHNIATRITCRNDLIEFLTASKLTLLAATPVIWKEPKFDRVIQSSQTWKSVMLASEAFALFVRTARESVIYTSPGKFFEHVQVLDLGNIKVTDEELFDVAKMCKQLVSFSVHNKDITATAILQLIKTAAHTLKSLNLSACARLEVGYLFRACMGPSQVTNSSSNSCQLEELNLRSTRVNDSDIQYLALSLATLRKLDISSNKRIGNAALVAIAESKFPLEELSVAGCQDVTNDGIQALAMETSLTHHSLKTLNISNTNVSQASLDIVLNGLKGLRDLEAMSCSFPYRRNASLPYDHILSVPTPYLANPVSSAQRVVSSSCGGSTLETISPTTSRSPTSPSSPYTPDFKFRRIHLQFVEDVPLLHPISRSIYLQELVIHQSGITNNLLREIGQLEFLKILEITECRFVTESGVLMMLEGPVRRKLEAVTFALLQLSKPTIQSIARRCPQLRYLKAKELLFNPDSIDGTSKSAGVVFEGRDELSVLRYEGEL